MPLSNDGDLKRKLSRLDNDSLSTRRHVYSSHTPTKTALLRRNMSAFKIHLT